MEVRNKDAYIKISKPKTQLIMKNLIAVTILSVLTVLSLLLSVKGSAQEIVWEEDTNRWFDESRTIRGTVFLDFIAPENVYDVVVFRVTEHGEKIPYAARYTTESKRTNSFDFYCEGEFYAVGTGEEGIVTEMYFSVTKDMRVSDEDKEYTYVMELE